jgi:hypothetical protein
MSAYVQPTDGGLVVRMPEYIVDRREIEIHLAGELGLRSFHFQVDRNVCAQLQMVEEEVDKKLPVTHFQPVLAAHKREAHAEFEKELPQMIE